MKDVFKIVLRVVIGIVFIVVLYQQYANTKLIGYNLGYVNENIRHLNGLVERVVAIQDNQKNIVKCIPDSIKKYYNIKLKWEVVSPRNENIKK